MWLCASKGDLRRHRVNARNEDPEDPERERADRREGEPADPLRGGRWLLATARRARRRAAALHAARPGALGTAADGVDECVSVLLEPGIIGLRSLLAAALAPVVDPAVVAGGDLTADVGERLLSLGEDEVD